VQGETGRQGAVEAPSTFDRAAPPRLDGALVVGVSQSGRSPNFVRVLREAGKQGCPTIAVTNDAASPLARAAAHVVPLGAGPGRAVAATKTYTAELVALAVLAGALPSSGRPVAGRPLATMADAVSAVLDGGTGARLAGVLSGSDRCAVIGRGLDLATAHEWALKLTELTGVLAHAWSSADLRHGPIALAEDGFPVLLVSTDPAHAEELVDLARDVAARGARVGLLTDRPVAGLDGVVEVLPAGGPLVGVVSGAVAAQLATFQVARDRGRDPDAPPASARSR
jgi:glucosamine--fructose-6-phosphate aminotransferase (isomerizing)